MLERGTGFRPVPRFVFGWAGFFMLPTKFFPLLRKMPEMPELEPRFQPNLSFSIVSKPIFKTSLPEL